MVLRTRRRFHQGFSLVEISIVLAILSVVLSGILPYITETTKGREVDTTLERLDKIEEAIIQFYIANTARIPCPADPTVAIGTAAFGDGSGNQAATPPTCTAANLLSSGNARGGAIPIKQLGLPDEYAFDGWGRKFLYNVDINSTGNSFTADGTLNVKVTRSAAAATDLTATASYVIVSHGSNGHGGYTRSGGATRMSAGSLNEDERENCSIWNDGNCATGSYNAIFVKKSPTSGTANTSTFDDVIRYKPTALLRNVLGPTGLWAPYGNHIANTNSGNVGIGTTTPGAKLDVNGVVLASGNSGFTQLFSESATVSAINANTGARLDLRSGNAPYLTVATNGNVGIGTAVPTAKLSVAGAVSIAGGDLDMNGRDINNVVQINPPSDRRLKRDIEPLDAAAMLKKLLKVEAVRYYFKSDAKNRLRYGVIAQDIEDIFPALVKTDADKRASKSVNYMDLIAPMIAAMQEQQRQIDALTKRLDACSVKPK